MKKSRPGATTVLAKAKTEWNSEKKKLEKKNWRAQRPEERTGKEERSTSPFPFPRLPLGLLRSPNFLFRPIQFSLFSLVPGYLKKGKDV